MVSAWAVESHTGRSAVQKWPTLLRIYFAKKNKLYVIKSVIGSIFMFLFFEFANGLNAWKIILHADFTWNTFIFIQGDLMVLNW